MHRPMPEWPALRSREVAEWTTTSTITREGSITGRAQGTHGEYNTGPVCDHDTPSCRRCPLIRLIIFLQGCPFME